jgi:nicotinamide riboside transporter PnuC
MRTIINYKILEMIGAVCGIAGAVLVSLNIPQSKYGFVLFLISSILLGVVSWQRKMQYLLTMQMVFLGINVVGVARWF